MKFRKGNLIGLLAPLLIVLMLNTLGIVKAQNSTSYITSVAWSPDGNKIAVGYGTSFCEPNHPEYYIIQIFDAQMNQVLQTLSGSLCDITSLDWSPDTNRLAASSRDSIGIRVWNTQTGQLLMSSQIGGQGANIVRWQPFEDHLIFADVSNGVSLIDPVTGEGIATARIGGTTLDWSPDGTKLLTASAYQNTSYVMDIMSGQQLLILEGHIAPINSVDWSPDSTKLATGGGLDDPNIRIWDASTGQNTVILQGHTTAIRQIKWNPNSTFLASASSDGSVRVWDISTGTEIANYQYPGRVNTISWNPDGTQLIYGGWRNDGQPSNIEIVIAPQPSTCDSTIPASDTTSLISAINTGNNGGSPYSICLADSIYTLNAVDNSNFIGANALPVITGDITIIGNGATLERAVSAPDFRFFRVENGATLTLENLTLDNGHTSGTSDAGDGGAIYNDGTLSLDSVILTNNIANIEAGAIYNNDDQILNITNSSFTGNRALGDDGGAIDNHGSATISSTTFADNHSDSDDGGAIWNDDNAILTISDSIFSLNSAFDEGGIIMNFGTITLNNNIIANNSSGDDGGAISSDSGSITISGGNFSNNIAGDDGGAIMSYAPLNLSGVTLDGNQTNDKGGAIYVWDSDLIIDNSTLSNNVSLNNGGAIYIGNAGVSSYLLNSCVFGNTAGNTSGVYAENDNFNATLTWWGAIDGPGGSGTGSGDEVNSDVNFANFVATNCADAMSATTQTQSLAILANTVADSSNFPVVGLPYSNNFADNSDLSGSVRWTRDETGWLLDTDIRGQRSSLEMTIWIELSNNPQVNLSYLERADLASNDTISLEIQVQGSSDWIVLTQNIGISYDWQEANISLADYRGETIRLRWTADIPADAPPSENSLSYAIEELQISRQ